MTSADDPITIVQNPFLGGYLLWEFARGYAAESQGDAPVIPLFFPVLPLVFHSPTLKEVTLTQTDSGLGRLVLKLSKNRECLIAIHDRTLRMRSLTCESIGLAAQKNLLTVNYENAKLRANDIKPATISADLRYHVRGANKIGRWFARQSSVEIFYMLEVVA